MSYTISNIYTKLNHNFNFKINKLNNKLKIFKSINFFLFLIKLKLARRINLYNKITNLTDKSKFIVCISYTCLKTFFCNLFKLQKNVFKHETKKNFLKKWLKEKFVFNINYTQIFTDLIIYYYSL